MKRTQCKPESKKTVAPTEKNNSDRDGVGRQLQKRVSASFNFACRPFG